MSFNTINKKLAVKQLLIAPPKSELKSGFAMIQQNTQTVTTELLFDAEVEGGFYMKGSKIAFLGNSSMKPWNKEVFSHDGVEFVLAPLDEVVMVASEA